MCTKSYGIASQPISVCGTVTVRGRGRAGIAISNGETVVSTGRGGCFRLDMDPARHRFLFVVTPSGAVGRGNFYKPVGKIRNDPGAVDFDLIPSRLRRRREFEFAHLSDFHLRHKRDATSAVTTSRTAPTATIIRHAVKQVLSRGNPAFAVVTGDLTQFGDIPSLNAFRRIMESATCPMFPMFGAHDSFEGLLSGEPVEERRNRRYESILGPTYYSFDWGGRHFVIYPNEDDVFSPIDREMKSKWLENDLQAHSQIPTLLFLHEPPTCSFLDHLVPTSVFAVLHGHWHSSKSHVYRGIQILHTSCLAFGGVDGSPRGGRLISFRRGRMTTQLVHVHNRPPQKRLSSPKPRPASRTGGPLQLLWSRRLDGELHRAAPVVVDKRIILCPRAEEGPGCPGIVCLDLADGSDHWHLSTDAPVKNSVSIATATPSSRPTDRDRAAAITVTGRLFVFELSTGKVLWKVDLPEFPERWIYASPANVDSVVYAGGQAGFGAYRLSSGRQLWYYKPTDRRLDCFNCYAGPVVTKTSVILLIEGRGLVALDRTSGREKWWHEFKPGDVWMRPRPIVRQGKLIAAGEYGELVNLDVNSGEVLWRRWINRDRHWDQTMTGLGASQSTVFLVVPSGEFQARSLASGRLKWRFRFGEDLLDMTSYLRRARGASGGPIASRRFIAVGAGDGHLYLLDPRTGAPMDKWWFGSPISAPPCTGQGKLIVAAFDGLLACFDFQ